MGVVVMMQAGAQCAIDCKRWLASILLTGRLSTEFDAKSMLRLLDFAKRESVLPILEYRLREGDGWAGLTEDMQAALMSEARDHAVRDMARQHELRQVADALTQAGLRVLLLKGNALGLWLYPQSYLREVSDIDLLLVSHEALEHALTALAPLGYLMPDELSRFSYEHTAVRTIFGGARSELDLHTRLLNAPVFADVLPFDVLWTRSMPVDGLPETMRVLCPVHALLHASLNRALDMQFAVPDTLRLLYDAHLLALKLTHDEWLQLRQEATERALCGVVYAMLEATIGALSTPVPVDMLQALQSQAQSETLDSSRLGDWRYMQRMNLRALPGVRARLGWLWHRLLPGREKLRKRYGDASLSTLLWRRVRQGWRRLLS